MAKITKHEFAKGVVVSALEELYPDHKQGDSKYAKLALRDWLNGKVMSTVKGHIDELGAKVDEIDDDQRASIVSAICESIKDTRQGLPGLRKPSFGDNFSIAHAARDIPVLGQAWKFGVHKLHPRLNGRRIVNFTSQGSKEFRHNLTDKLEQIRTERQREQFDRDAGQLDHHTSTYIDAVPAASPASPEAASGPITDERTPLLSPSVEPKTKTGYAALAKAAKDVAGSLAAAQ